jgi:hypothetical protein
VVSRSGRRLALEASTACEDELAGVEHAVHRVAQLVAQGQRGRGVEQGTGITHTP